MQVSLLIATFFLSYLYQEYIAQKPSPHNQVTSCGMGRFWQRTASIELDMPIVGAMFLTTTLIRELTMLM